MEELARGVAALYRVQQKNRGSWTSGHDTIEQCCEQLWSEYGLSWRTFVKRRNPNEEKNSRKAAGVTGEEELTELDDGEDIFIDIVCFFLEC